MNNLIIDNHVIKKDIKAILSELKAIIINGKLKDVEYKPDNVRITCPNHEHKNGHEDKPSCDIYIGDSDKVIFGTTHCFACGFKGQLYNFVAEAADKSVSWAKKWLCDNFTEYTIESKNILIDDYIDLNYKNTPAVTLPDDILTSYQSWHPYLNKRNLSKDICKRFEVKYDPDSECIVFPVRDIKGNLKFLTRRSVVDKRFIIDKDIEKEVYLLYNIIKDSIKEVYVVESQINALTLWSWGYPAIALLGTGSDYQYKLLKKSNILKYNLCFDGDIAGDNGIERFITNTSDNVFIDVILMKRGKDVNDLTKEEFDNLPIISSDDWLKNNTQLRK